MIPLAYLQVTSFVEKHGAVAMAHVHLLGRVVNSDPS